MRSESSVQLSGRNSRRPTITGTSRDANVNETITQNAFRESQKHPTPKKMPK
jgi:hypothetical protein